MAPFFYAQWNLIIFSDNIDHLIKQEKNEMTKLSAALAEVIESEFQKDIELESSEREYLPQSAFKDCSSRASAMMYNGITRAQKIYSLAILMHRERDHGENHAEERDALISTMSTEDIVMAETRGWWKD